MKKIEVSQRANLPTKYGHFIIKAYKEYFKDHYQEHLAIMSKNFDDLLKNDEAIFVRVHSECLTGDTLGSLKCDCANQLHLALELINKKGGLIIYHRQEGRNIGLLNKVNAYKLQEEGLNTIEANLKLGFKADERDYSVVKFIFDDLNIKKIKLITNNPQKIEYIQKECNIKIVERIPAITQINDFNKDYINTKKECMGHMF